MQTTCICRSGDVGCYSPSLLFTPRFEISAGVSDISSVPGTVPHLDLYKPLCWYLGRVSLGSLTKCHIVLVGLKVTYAAVPLLMQGQWEVTVRCFLWISTVVSFCVVTCLCVALRLNLCMICGKKPLLMAVCFMMDNSSFYDAVLEVTHRVCSFRTGTLQFHGP
jgi:hypothetical protein